MIHQNVGGIDRVLRLALGGIFFLGGLILLTGRTTLGVALAVVGSLALLTGIVRFCALYIPFGISTARPERLPICQVCDCAAQMKAMQTDRAAVAPEDIAEEEVSEAMTAARGR
jgi:hypothetical protein